MVLLLLQPQIDYLSLFCQALIGFWILDSVCLSCLNCEGNQLRSLPPEIGELRALTKLNLAFNMLESAAAELGQLSSLITLNLSHNKLVGLFSQIGGLRSLSDLNLSHNQLETLPDSMADIKVSPPLSHFLKEIN